MQAARNKKKKARLKPAFVAGQSRDRQLGKQGQGAKTAKNDRSKNGRSGAPIGTLATGRTQDRKFTINWYGGGGGGGT